MKPRSTKASIRLPVLAVLAAGLLAAGGGGFAQETVQEAAPETGQPAGLTITSETPSRGEYRLVGHGKIRLAEAQAVEILLAFDQHCAEGCRWPISSLDRIDVLEAKRDDPRIVTWTFVDDVMDASYFQVASQRSDSGDVELIIETPDEATLSRLVSDERPHKPFFHRQRTVWRFATLATGELKVKVEMEMASSSFMVNLMPKRVLEGAENSLREYFAHLEAAAHSSD